MLNLPIVKFEKSCNYLNEQLTLQNNNKQLILDIISNIGLILNESDEKFEQYDNILETANEFLKSLSANITSIEQLNVEIKNITAELTSLLSEQNKASKTKEFYIAAFSNIKHNIIVYSKKFQELESALTNDNNKFNEFINENNFKYNFVSIDDSTNTYTFTGFSINDTEEISNDIIEIPLNDTSDDEIEKTEVIEENINNEITESSIDEIVVNKTENEEVIAENIVDKTENEESISENIVDKAEIEEAIPENIDKIEELTNTFKSLLLNISETSLTDATSSVVSLFKELLPKDTQTSFEDFLDLGNNSENIQEESVEIEENESPEIELNAFDSLKLVEDFIIADLENVIYEEHSGLIYEYNVETNEISSYEELIEENIENTELVENIDIETEDLSNDDYNIIIDDEEIIENSEVSPEYIQDTQEVLESPLPPTEITVVENEPIIEESFEEVAENSDILLLDALLDNSEYLSTESILEKLEQLEKIEEFTLSSNSTSLSDDKIIEEQDEKIENIDESPILELDNLDNNDELFVKDLDDVNEDVKDTNEFSLLELDNPDNNDELFVEDLDDVNEEVENTNDIDILIDNIETIENVEKSVFEELNNDTSFLSNISFDGILNTSEFDLNTDTSIFEDILDKEILEKLDENDILDDNLIGENILDETLLGFELEENIIDEMITEESVIDQLLNESNIETPDIDISDSEIINQEDYQLDSNEITLDNLNLLNNVDIESLSQEIEVPENITFKDSSAEQAVQHDEEKNIEHFYKDNHSDAEFKNKGLSKKDFDEKLLKIENALEDNKTLVISERLQKIYLPYKVSELTNYIENYPGSYNSLKDVVAQEFILPFDYFRKHPTKARFTEAYNLLKNREGRNFMKSVSYAFRLLNKNNLNPAIIASCKTQHELDSYLYYLDSDNLNNFKFFDIIYEVNPM